MPSYQNVKIRKAIEQYATNGQSRKWMYEILMIGEIKKQTENTLNQFGEYQI